MNILRPTLSSLKRYRGQIVSLLLLIFASIPAFASGELFAAGYEWRSELRGNGVESTFTTETLDGTAGVVLTFDFEAVGAEEPSVWVGISAKDIEIPQGTTELAFRTACKEGCLLKFSIMDSAGVGYDLTISVGGGGDWQTQTIPLEYSAFATRWGKSADEAPKEITFPLTRVAIAVLRSPDYPQKGSVNLADLAPKGKK